MSDRLIGVGVSVLILRLLWLFVVQVARDEQGATAS